MPVSDALPGWDCFLDTERLSTVSYLRVALDSAQVGVINGSSPFVPQGFPIGAYSLSLQTSTFGHGTSASVAQTGELPSDAKSIRFSGYEQVTGGIGFSVKFAGNLIPLQIISSKSNYNEYGGDISRFAS